jgi:hypothetical protein
VAIFEVGKSSSSPNPYADVFSVGAAALYNGSTIVARSATRGTPIIYINFNYRLGSLGFPTGFEADEKKALNLGLRDQIAALSWIQENIEFFGGDKNKVRRLCVYFTCVFSDFLATFLGYFVRRERWCDFDR